MCTAAIMTLWQKNLWLEPGYFLTFVFCRRVFSWSRTIKHVVIWSRDRLINFNNTARHTDLIHFNYNALNPCTVLPKFRFVASKSKTRSNTRVRSQSTSTESDSICVFFLFIMFFLDSSFIFFLWFIFVVITVNTPFHLALCSMY